MGFRKGKWTVGYTISYADGHDVRDSVTVGPCRLLDVVGEAHWALSYLLSLDCVRGVNFNSIRSAR